MFAGQTLWKRYRAALEDRNRQREAHQGLTNSLPQDLVKEWASICESWERAPYPKAKAADGLKLVNLFSIKRECECFLYFEWDDICSAVSLVMTQAQVVAELALEDEMRDQRGASLRNRTRPGQFILMGLDLEESQCVNEFFHELVRY